MAQRFADGRRRVLRALGAAGLALACPGLLLAEPDQAMTSRGYDLLMEGKPTQALGVLKEAARRDPANPWVFNLLGRAYYQSGEPRQAAESFRAALRIDPADGYSRLMLDYLGQAKLPPAPEREQGGRQGRSRRPSSLEEQAREELEALAKGKTPAPLILIDPGHGGADKGVSGASLAEKDVTLSLAMQMERELKALGTVRAVLTRRSDHDVPLWARAAMATLYAADLMVSLHCGAALSAGRSVGVFWRNAAPGDEQDAAVADLENGVQRFERFAQPAFAREASEASLLLSWRQGGASAAGERLAGSLARALTGPGAPPAPLSVVRVGRGPFRVLEAGGCPALLVEAGYLSDTGAEQALKRPEFLGDLAACLARGLTAAMR